MKKLCLAALPLLLMACSDGKNGPTESPESKAYIDLPAMSVSVDVKENETHNRAAESVDVSGFTITVTNTSTGAVVGSWKHSALPSKLLEVTPGGYAISVTSHAVKPAAWDEPLYAGAEEFTVEADAIHSVGIILCKLANVKVSVDYSDELKALMGANSTVTVTAGQSGVLEYSATETRSGYFQWVEGATTLVATFNGTIGGRPEQIVRTVTGVQPGHHYIITFPVKEGGYIDPTSVGVDISVIDSTLNITLQPEDDDLLDDSDRPGGSGDDTPTPPVGGDEITFSSSTLSFTEENPINVPEAKVDIHADRGIEHLEVEIISDFLTDEFLRSVGLAAYFDLAEPGELSEGLSSLGFPIGDDVKGHTDLTFDITQFLPLIFEEGLHHFRLTVTDADGNKATRTLTFRV